MDCRSCEKHINDYLDGELSNREEKKLQKHMKTCEACKMALDQYRYMWDQLGELETFTPGENFEVGILSKLEAYGAPEDRGVRSGLWGNPDTRRKASALRGVRETREDRSALRGARETRGDRSALRGDRETRENYGLQQRDPVKDGILIIGYFITLFVVLSVLRNQVFQHVDWISGILVTARVFRDVFDGMIFRGLLSLMVVYPIRILHWARVNFSQLSVEGRMLYSVVLLNLLLIGTFSHILLHKMARGGKKRKAKGGNGDEIQRSES